MSDYFAIANKQISTPYIVGATNQVYSQNYPATSLEYPPDSFELSTVSQKKKQEKGLSTAAKWIIGIGGIITGTILAHKLIPPNLVKNRTEKIFLENFSKDEAKAIQKKYQDILEMKDKDKAVDKIFEELKKDYKIDDLTIKLNKNYKAGEKMSDAITAAAICCPEYKKGYIEIGLDVERFDLQKLLVHLTHELRHVKQHKLTFQTSTLDEYEKMMYTRAKNVFPKESENALKNFAKEEAQEFEKYFKKCKVSRIAKDDKNYEWGRNILDSQKIYANGSVENYEKNAFYETDAKFAENTMLKMVKNWLI